MSSEERYLYIKELTARFKVHRNTIINWSRAGTFPKPKKLGYLTRWVLSEVLQWESQQQRALEGQGEASKS